MGGFFFFWLRKCSVPAHWPVKLQPFLTSRLYVIGSKNKLHHQSGLLTGQPSSKTVCFGGSHTFYTFLAVCATVASLLPCSCHAPTRCPAPASHRVVHVAESSTGAGETSSSRIHIPVKDGARHGAARRDAAVRARAARRKQQDGRHPHGVLRLLHRPVQGRGRGGRRVPSQGHRSVEV